MAADNPLARLAALASALDVVATAASAANSEALAASESVLADAVAGMPAAVELSGCLPDELMLQLRRIQLALQRCRRVGAALTELVTASLAAQGMAPAYAPAGAAGHSPRLGRLEVRA
jgi:hypothetical protein